MSVPGNASNVETIVAARAPGAGSQLPVLVVGAGPVGLTAAIELHRRGVAVRVIDRMAGPSALSKALAVWPRTLEILRQLGGAPVITERGLPVDSLRYFSTNRPIATVRFNERTRPVVLPQPDVEDLLLRSLSAVGGAVERGTELLELQQGADEVVATLALPGGETCEDHFSFVIGADGTGSTVRSMVGVEFEGATYPSTFVVADVDLGGGLQHDASYYYCSPRGILVLVGLPGGRFRVFTSAPTDLDRDHVPLDVVQALVDERGPGGLHLTDPSWVSAFSVHARHATRSRVGRVFLAGDSAHAHSPAGGQGLNTGIGDAHNLAWKLALVWRGEASSRLLDSYSPERAQVAHAVVRQADLQTRAWLLRRPHEVALRDALLRAASRAHLPEVTLVPFLAGLRTVYVDEPVGTGARSGTTRTLGGFQPGALAPDWPVWETRVFRRAPLRSLLDPKRYTVLVSRPDGTPDGLRTLARLIEATGSHLVDLRTLDAHGTHGTLREGLHETRSTGFGPGGRRRLRRRRPAVVLIRPDQHIDTVVAPEQAHVVLDRLRSLLRFEGPGAEGTGPAPGAADVAPVTVLNPRPAAAGGESTIGDARAEETLAG
jgi:3-(3-hydroxy-phenyl)propionate hydroxylase